jgi:hypothetical protein
MKMIIFHEESNHVVGTHGKLCQVNYLFTWFLNDMTIYIIKFYKILYRL